MNIYLAFIVGLALGIALIIAVWFISKRSMRESFRAVSSEVLSKNIDDFLKLAGEFLGKQSQVHQKELEKKKELIDQTHGEMKDRLREVQDLVSSFKEDHRQQYGDISAKLKFHAEQTTKLQETTSHIQTALGSSRIRGQWGERMAEDILRLAGFIEGINYRKQKVLESGRPDYTFLLPQNLIVNMDVKFPFDNYLHYLEAKDESERQRHKEQFLKDVRARIKEVTTRDYINPAANTIDYVILFIPNEQVYAFINEADGSILDQALKNRVILCSPLTLYAILAVIRQAVDNFNLERTAGHILSLLGAFNKQWNLFIKSMERMGNRIDDARREFDALLSTRRQQLERPLKQIESLRTEKGINIDMLTNEKEEISEELQEGQN
ncbi:MAG: DNA recombination protein RmuC [Candidatus Omnitrophota bacterium]|jgi:DNA recombination protein RmuC